MLWNAPERSDNEHALTQLRNAEVSHIELLKAYDIACLNEWVEQIDDVFSFRGCEESFDILKDNSGRPNLSGQP
ncbi:ribonucleotide-diphosphate reductase subunit alpha [Leifsonia xyli subsp. cynodontis DSM 46306]|uniref:Uncharacterized protein n=1 Tax=Leifsonia xyli subsp. cynodontis DSM 46306 TaxID=1389489 RepID=U3PA19_LEIXC|nr:ribonucleotide-diphosphate reductase subunit alpha [Leifsonia xyli subsp. cynodontis DSM 46306]